MIEGKAMSIKLGNLFIVIFCTLVLPALFFACGGGNVKPDDGNVSVVSFEPSEKVMGRQNITVSFSVPVVDAALVGQPLADRPLVIKPEIAGVFKWISTDSLRFYPDAELPGGMTYEVAVTASALKLPGLKLGGRTVYALETQKFEIVQADVSIRYSNFEEKLAAVTVDLQFNYPVEAKDLKAALRFDLEGAGEVAFEPTEQKADTRHSLESAPLKMTDASRRMLLKLAQALPTVAGNTFIAADYVRELTVEGRKTLKIESIQPEQRGDYFSIYVQFSSYVDLERIRPHVVVGGGVEYRLENAWRGFYIAADFLPGSVYRIELRKGYMAEDASLLENDFVRDVLIPDYEPVLRFSSPGWFLPQSGSGRVGIDSVNVRMLKVSVSQVYRNNIVHFLNSYLSSGGYYDGYYGDEYYYGGSQIEALGRTVREEDVSVALERNRRVGSEIDVGALLDGNRRGIYIIEVRNADGYQSDRKWVLSTDIGLMAKQGRDEMLVFANSLNTLAPVSGAKITLLSRNNQEIAGAVTDANGAARIPGVGALRETFEPYVIVAEKGDDCAFMRFSDSQLSSADFDVSGASAPEAWRYRSYVFTERGVYRPDDTAHIGAIVRRSDLAQAQPMPVRLTVYSPDMRRFKVLQQDLNDGVTADFTVEIPGYAMTGRYRAELALLSGEKLGEATFQVEDFLPDRIGVKLTSDRPQAAPGDKVKLDVKAALLFGPPAAGRRVEARARISAVPFAPDAYGSFSFSDSSRSFDRQYLELGEAVLDADGRAVFEMEAPSGLTPPSSLDATVTTTVLDEGGRAVSAAITLPLHPYPYYVGAKKSVEGYAEPGRESEFEVIALSHSGAPEAGRGLEVEFFRVTWNTSLQRDERGFYRYVSERREESVEKRSLTSGAGPVKTSFTPKDVGYYRMVLRAGEGGAAADVNFYASGWGYAPWAMSSPDRLKIDLDRREYAPGDRAVVQIRSPFAGKLFLSVERDGVDYYRVIDMKENTASITLDVAADWAPNVYVVGTLIRSADALEPYAPARAYGAAPLFVSYDRHRLQLNLSAAPQSLPNSDVEIRLEVKGGAGSGWAAIAAVDEGILQLTGFVSPDPLKSFFARRRLEVSTHDVYSFILPELKAARKKSDSGGDAMDDSRRKNLNPVTARRVKPVALYSGLIRLDAAGRAAYTVKVPEFNGSLRLMALAFDGARFGAAESEMKVADRIVLQPSLPMVLAPGDAFDIPVSVFNRSGSGPLTIKVSAEGPLEIVGERSRSIAVPDGGETLTMFAVRAADRAGKVVVTVSAAGNGRNASVTSELAVRPASPLTIESGSGVIEAGRTQSIEIPGGWLPGTARPRLILSGLPLSVAAGSLQYLLEYPHGCAEQTVSRAFPLLYYADLAARVAPQLFADRSADYYVNEAIDKLESMQLPSGGFSYWPASTDENEWATLWAAHFLVEARRAGYLVQDSAWDAMFARLRAFVSESTWSEDDAQAALRLERKVYALYVLALMERPDAGAAAYVATNQSERLEPWARMLLAAAFRYAGDAAAAARLLPKSFAPQTYRRESGGNFNSDVRADALMLSMLADVDPSNPAAATLAGRLSAAARLDRYGNTQENALALLALGKLLRRSAASSFHGSVSRGLLKGGLAFDEKGLTLSDPDLAGAKLEVKISGGGPCYYFWQVEGVAQGAPVKEYDVDLAVRRRLLDRSGAELDYRNVPQGALLIAEITLKSPEDLENVVVTDMLPAGLEIENPRLQSRENFDWIQADGKYAELYPQHVDMRDDRLLLFAGLNAGREYRYYYALRAVTAGDFALPPVKAESMYDPTRSSLASSGAISVKKVQ